MSFSKSTRKVSTVINTPKSKAEGRNKQEVGVTVKNTLHSNWTPIKNGALNSTLFEERKILIGHWFENWSDVQQRQFLEHLVEKFNKMSIHFVHNMIKERLPPEPVDFTSTLPQNLSLKIFSYLDPRTLAQGNLVSWHWKWLCEHDVVWKPKCLRRGWDYGAPEPPYERAVWKRFYQQQVWDLLHPETDGRRKRSTTKPPKPKTYKLGEAQPMNVGYLKHKETELPPWRCSDNNPKDIQLFNKTILGINSESVPRHISEKFQKIEIARNPNSPRCNSPQTKSFEPARKSTSKERVSFPMQSKSMVAERDTKTDSPMLKSLSSGNMVESPPPKRNSNKIRNQQGPMQRKLSGVSTKTMTNAANRANQRSSSLKNNNGSDSVEDVNGQAAWGVAPAARKVASTDTLGSDAALDQESNDSLYGDDSGKLNGEAWELQSNLSDQ